MKAESIITIEQLVTLENRICELEKQLGPSRDLLRLMLEEYSGLKPGMELVVTEEARKHLGGASGVVVGHGATVGNIWIDTRSDVVVEVKYNDWGSNVQSLERVLAMRVAYLQSIKKVAK